MRSNYWSNSKFAKWLWSLVDVKPIGYGTSEDFRVWEEKQKKNHPYLYWFVEGFLDSLRAIVFWPLDKFNTIKSYIRNRYIDKTHFIHTGLEKGQYHEIDDKILHGLFNTLIEFIEVEKAWMNFDYKGEDAGLDYLEWEIGLTFDEDWGVEKDGQPTPQALAAKEQFELYNWWKNRPNRQDPYEQYHRLRKGKDVLGELTEREENIFKQAMKLEAVYEKEDEEMLIRLIKIRRSLWT